MAQKPNSSQLDTRPVQYGIEVLGHPHTVPIWSVQDKAAPVTMQGMAAKKAQSPAMEFLVTSLTKDPAAQYAALKAKADEKKLAVFPIMFGRAQALLGIVKSAKRGTGKSAKATRAAKATKAPTAAAPVKRGRPTNAASKSGQIRELLMTGMSATEIAKKIGCTIQLVYNVKARVEKPVKRGPGRPPKAKAAPTAPAAASLDGIAGIVAAVQGNERQRAKMRTALERIQAVVAEALA